MIAKTRDDVTRTPGADETAALADELNCLAHGEPWHGPSLDALLSGVSVATAAARPIAGAHTIWELVLHLTGWTDVVQRRLDGEALEEPVAGDFPLPSEAAERPWAAAMEGLRQANGRLVERVAALSDADLDSPVNGRDYRVRFMLRGAICHMAYHSGQIGLLRKLAS